MKKINLIFALLLSLMGVTQVFADNADFENALPEGWEAVGTMTYYERPKTGTYSIGNSVSSGWDTNRGNYIKTTMLEGDITLWLRSYKSGSTGYVVLFKLSEDGETVGDKLTAFSSSSTTFAEKTYTLSEPTRLAIVINYAHLDNMTYTSYVQADGPAFAAYDGTSKLTSPYSYSFGMVPSGTSKSFTLKNPGTADLGISVSETGNFAATLSASTIAAGGEATLTVTMPNATGSSSVTITPDAESIAPFVINVSGVVRDANKMFEDFSGKALPAEWSSTGSWTFTDGYAKTGNNTNLQLTTPMMVFEDGETFAFDAAGCSSWASYGAAYQGKVIVQTSTDGTNFSDLQTFSGMGLDEWQNCSVTIPAGTKFVRFVASYASIDNIYGGKLDETPRPKLEVEGIANGGSLSWGYSNVSAGTTKTITLKNDGTADLDVTIAATDDYTIDPASATIEAGGTVVVTIGTPAHDGNGVLTITPAEGSGLSPYTINLTSYYKEPKPVMSIDKTSIAFGKVNEVKSETITVSNTGDADLVVTIANDNTENFSVEPADQLIVAPGEEGTITITYNFVESIWGTFNANVKLTPNYGGTYDVKTIAVSATSKDPNVWDEDFESGELDQDWIASDWSISTPGSYSGGNGTKMVGGNSRTATLITPRLIATEGQQLTFELGGSSSSYPLAVEYSTDRESWTEVASFTEDGTCSIDAPVTDPTTFYLRFTGWVYIDNLNGFKLDKPEHDAAITAVSIPATGNQYVEYTASVTVKELAGKDENVNVEFYLGEDMVGEASGTLDPNGTETFEVKFTPTAPFEGEASFTVTFVSDDDEVFATFETDPVEVTIAAAPVLDETTGSLDDFENWGRYDVIELKYSLKEGWNTVILPFAWSDLSVFGEGAKAYSFDNYTNGAIDFKAVNELNVQTPYIIYAPAAKDKVVFLNVTNFRTSTEATDLSISHNGAVFQGTYAPIAAPGMQGKYGVVPSSGKIAKGGVNATLKGFRGYFELPAGATGAKINFYDENDNLIDAIDAVELNNAINGNLYDLSGRKVEGKAKAGVYIQNGKKVVVK